MTPVPSLRPLTRRRLLAGMAATVTAFALPARSFGKEKAADGYRVLHARTSTALLRGKDAGPTPIWGYDGMSPGPTMRIKQGDELKVRLVNDLEQSTVIHWHGLRLPNAMDGVPFLTQKPIEPGQSFDYHFVPPDAGTFWYHTHFGSSEQLARGLYGVLIVAERNVPQVDRDLILVVDDWRLMDNGEIQPSFMKIAVRIADGRRSRSVLAPVGFLRIARVFPRRFLRSIQAGAQRADAREHAVRMRDPRLALHHPARAPVGGQADQTQHQQREPEAQGNLGTQGNSQRVLVSLCAGRQAVIREASASCIQIPFRQLIVARFT